ncbi:MAG: hypothetical protein GC192_16625 [Bacteroidetes bacterium]|nr:hypothetical protein [Bacteroidota bacterium]
MKNLAYLFVFISIWLLQSCQKDDQQVSVQPEQKASEQRYEGPIDLSTVTSRSSCPWTVIPAGSTDALAAAIASTCDDGVIYLKAGLHTENSSVTVGKAVKIIGEAGAVLKIKSDLSIGDATTGAVPLHPALHILNAPGTLIQDLDIQPIGSDGGNALLIENSDGSGVMRNKFTGFQMSIVIEKSNRMTIMFNTVVTSGLWQTGQVADAYGITVMNGTSAYLSDNEVSNSLFGIWACDKWGTAERNLAHGNYIGIILCKVPSAIQLPSGEITGSINPATGWKTRNNKSIDNFNVGYLAIDGANHNLIENNEASGNAAYDMELTTDTYRFGFLTPMAHDNTVVAGTYPNITIKNCGDNNSVTGGVLVDMAADPCN